MSSDNTSLPPLPANHLSHPENWATGSEPVTSNQAGFISVLEGQHPDLIPEGGVDTSKLSKSDASDVIDKLKKGEKLDESVNDSENHVESGGKSAAATSSSEKEESSAPSKRKEHPSTAEADKPASLEAATAQAGSEEKEDPKGATTESGEVKASASAPETMDKEVVRPAKKARTEKEEGETEKAGGETAEDAIEVDTPTEDAVETPAKPVDAAPASKTNGSNSASGNGTNGNGSTKKAENGGAGDETTPGDEAHLDHPENWATGDQPATDKQKGFIKVLEKQKGAEGVVGDVDTLGKSEASEKIDELKKM